MQFRHCLFSLLLLSASCSSEHASVSANKSTEYVEYIHPADPTNKLPEYISQIDPGVEVFPMTIKWVEEMGLPILYMLDPGFAKWCVLFDSIPENPPYEMQQKRIIQEAPDQYYTCTNSNSESIKRCKNAGKSTAMVISAKGYLPGEPVTIRLSGKDAHKEVTFYPRPLVLKKENGELLARATLCDAHPKQNLYMLEIYGVGKQEKYQFTSHSGEEILTQSCEGPIFCTILPEVLGQTRGIANITLQFEEGACYKMQLPWGLELMEYSLGNK
jgi:hypothetical protein